MAQTEDAMTGSKRGPGRPPSRDMPPANKKRKVSTDHTPLSSSLHSPAGHSPAPERRPTRLPSRILENRPLPTLAEPQPPSLPKDDYQSIAASAVLASSLERSRLKWIHDGVFERYWTKPETGKNARPPPPNNPELKWQKHKGPCRIRVEPHIFEAELYVEEKPAPKPAPQQHVKQYMPLHSAYGQPYRPPGQQQQHQGYGGNQYYQNRTLPPIQQPTTANTLPPIQNMNTPSPAPPPSQTPLSPAAHHQQQQQRQEDKKASPDPVISMLANRASSDPELKALMKEVATGNATQDQLKIFQSHIDELTKAISDKKKKEDEEAAATTTAAAAAAAAKPPSQEIQYDGPSDNNNNTSTHSPYQQQQQRLYQPAYQPQQPWAAPPPPTPAPPPPPPPPPAQPTPQPVILAFTTLGATEDRFLFPRHSILESLSPQHLLASFIVTIPARQTRQGLQGGDPTPVTAADGNVTGSSSAVATPEEPRHWQPVTLMIEVAYQREHILTCVKNWVLPADEVRKHMEDIIGKYERAGEEWLALRLPVKGSGMAVGGEEFWSGGEEEGVGSIATPVVAAEEKGAGKGGVKFVKKASSSSAAVEAGKGKKGESGQEKGGGVASQGSDAPGAVKQGGAGAGLGTAANGSVSAAAAPAVGEQGQAALGEQKDAGEGEVKEEMQTTESGRPRRAVRKSVRISEG